MRFEVAVMAVTISVFFVSSCSKSSPERVVAHYTGDFSSDIAEAMKAGDVKAVRSMIEKDASVLQIVDGQGRTLLHTAALLDNADLINLLVDKGIDPNVTDSSGLTPLSTLQESGFRGVKAKEALIKRGGKT